MQKFEFVFKVQELRKAQKEFEKTKPYNKTEYFAARRKKENLEAEIDTACNEYDKKLMSEMQGELF